MTAQTIDTRHRRRRRVRPRLLRGLAALLVVLAALYLAAQLALPPHAPAPALPAPPARDIPVLPPLPSIDAATSAPLPARRPPSHVLPDGSDAQVVPRDPFEGLEPLTAQELDRISQAH